MSRTGGADFLRIDNRELRPIAVAAQCLDNQWVSQELLRSMLDTGRSFRDPGVARRRLADARDEYLRALLNADQVVVNRAYLFNNPVVHQDFAQRGPARDAFRELLDSGVVVPFLLGESSPDVRPSFAVDEDGWTAWRGVLAETRPHCLRLSWNDGENRRYAQQALIQRFRRFLATLPVLDRGGLAQDLDLDADQVGGLLAVFREIAAWAVAEERVTRDELFTRFVVADGSPVTEGHFDRNKPFAGQVKQLVDLRYVTSLPDALDRFPLTPANSLHRTALQEERQLHRDAPALDPDELVEVLLRRQAFDLIQRPLAVSLDGLGLVEVRDARRTDEWQNYIRQLEGLLRAPREFDTRAQAVYSGYVGMARRLAEAVGDRRRTEVPAWVPTVKVVVEAVGTTLSIVYGDTTVADVSGAVSAAVAAEASTAVVRLVVSHHDRRRARRQLGTGIDVMRVRFERTKDDWDGLIARLRERGIPVEAADSNLEDDAAMDAPGDELIY